MSFTIEEDHVIPDRTEPGVKLEEEMVMMGEEPRRLLNQKHLGLGHQHSADNLGQMGLHSLTDVNPIVRMVGSRHLVTRGTRHHRIGGRKSLHQSRFSKHATVGIR
jgi:hypothetical protein